MDDDHTQPRPRLTLSRFVQLLGATTVELVTAPAGVDVEVAGPRIYDPADPGAIGRGEVVLGVNVRSNPESLIEEAAVAGAAAVALKGDATTLSAPALVASAAGIALIGVSSAVTWDQVYALTRNAAGAAGAQATESEQTPLGDLFALANGLAAAIGGAVTIEDPRSALLAYSNLDQPIDEPRRETILGRRTPGRWAARLEEEGVIRRLMTPPAEVVRIHDERTGASDRLVIGLWAGAERLGAIWVVEGDTPLEARAETLLGEAAPLAALHLLRHRAADDLTRRERGTLLHALLDGQRTAADIAASLGVDPASPCVVVGFHLAVEDDLDLVVQRTRAIDLIVLACEAFRRQVVCASVGDAVYALFPSLSPKGTELLESLVRDIAPQAADALGVRILAGIGSTVPHLDQVRTSRQDADRALRVLRRATDDERRVASIEQVRVESILLELGDLVRQRPELRPPALDLIANHDRDHSKAYTETLQALANASWDIADAAHALGLHPNSLRYRLKRLEEISGLALDDPGHRLVVALQFLT